MISSERLRTSCQGSGVVKRKLPVYSTVLIRIINRSETSISSKRQQEHSNPEFLNWGWVSNTRLVICNTILAWSNPVTHPPSHFPLG